MKIVRIGNNFVTFWSFKKVETPRTFHFFFF
jgi:hypothetical protein